MTSPPHGALVVFGSGPGIGRNVARLFAERGFRKIILLSRDAARLDQDVAFVREAAAPSTSVVSLGADFSDLEDTQRALRSIEKSLGSVKLESILFNAARLGGSKLLDFTPEALENDLRVSVISLYAIAQWALPRMVEAAASKSDFNPAFIVTSGMLYKDPAPAVFSLATCKAAQYNLVHSLHKEFEPMGVHCALIVVGGTVADKSEVTNARNIAETAWTLYSQKKGEKGKLEVLMMDPAFAEHVKKRENM